jgi:hypothetical protein
MPHRNDWGIPGPRPAAGGGRWLDVGPGRIGRWLTGFGERHGGVSEVDVDSEVVRFHAADGALAECHVPFPPLPPGADADPAGAVASHAAADRRVGVILVRLGGYAIGVFEGERLLVSKVGSRPVHGRNAAGGWSQHRFARRRDKQVAEALSAAAATAVRILEPQLNRLDATVFGGDRRAVDGLRDDARLAPLFALAVDRFLAVPDPKLAVLKRAPAQFSAVRIRLVEPPASPASPAEG